MATLWNKKLKLLTFYIGDKEHNVQTDDITPQTTLNTYLREKAHLTGTKRMCLEGGCGSCLVAVEEIDPRTQKRNIFSVNSCLVSIFSCHGWKIHTIEGIGDPIKGYHPIQKLLADHNGTQCGFCSSGMVMNMYALYESGPVTQQQVEDSFGGNICRCTGYRPILEAFKTLANDSNKDKCQDIEDYVPCYKRKTCKKDCGDIKKGFCMELSSSQWVKVYFLKDLLQILKNLGTNNYMLVGGNTAQGVYKPTKVPDVYIDISRVQELTSYILNENTLTLGANLSLNNTIKIFNDISSKNKQLSYLSKIANHISLVANVPVRNIGTIAGNLMIKHDHPEFPSDVFLTLETANATLVIVDTDGNETRCSPADFLNNNMTKRVIKEVILTGYDDTYVYTSYKIMPKAQNAHALVNSGFLFHIKGKKIASCRIVYGNINKNFVHATYTETFLKFSNIFDNSVLQEAYKHLDTELKAEEMLPEPPAIFRKNLAISLFYKFILSIAPTVPARYKSGGTILQRPLSQGHQEFGTNKSTYPLSEPLIKVEALAQTTGQAEYIDDIPDRPGQLFAAFVLAEAEANSTISNIDATQAMNTLGVVAFYSKDDIPGQNTFMPKNGANQTEEEVFCSGRVQFYSQPVGIVVAVTRDIAEQAADLVKVSYNPPAKKPYLNIQDVLDANDTSRITQRNTKTPTRRGQDVKHVIKETFYVDRQYHMHMEVQCCNVVPMEDNTFTVYSSTQWMDKIQSGVAAVLNIPNTKINVVVRRLGGAFGGKISRNGFLTAASAVASYKLKKPVKMWMPLTKNMSVMGKRFPCMVNYEVGVNDKGVIQYLTAKLYSDFGVGLNDDPLDLLFENLANIYDISTWSYKIYIVITDTHANTWARAPGTMEIFAFVESALERIAYELNMDALEVRIANLDKSRSQIMDYIKDLQSWADISNRQKQIEEFNKSNRWMKKAISINPMAWVMQVKPNYSVVVSIFHSDGTVAIYHGGTECGQGINTRIVQVAAWKLGISVNKVQVWPSASTITPNAFCTANSLTTEGNVFALLRACDTLLERIKPVRDKMSPGASWEDVIARCYSENIFLCATADYSPKVANYQQYLIFGVTATEVEVDILTGQHIVKRMDVIEDTGDSINPILDVGQAEGALVMGLGFFTTEEIINNSVGKILTNRTWNYYVPGPKDIPVDFRIKFPSNNPNPTGVLKSKSISECPICMTISIALAVKKAVASARSEADPNKPKWYPIDGCSTVSYTYLNSLNNYKQYTI